MDADRLLNLLISPESLGSYGLLRGAFRPGDAVCPLRSYARQMRRLTGDRSRCVLHMQKALTEMNVRLDSVIANITGLTGQRILRAIIDGERDPDCWCQFRAEDGEGREPRTCAW